MSCKHNETAVLYFTRSAKEEAHAKQFSTSGNFAHNKAIAQKLIDHTYTQVQETGLPVKVFNSHMQQGNTFGEKLGNAFQSLFDEGYENVIAVGNDCLQLTARDIQFAASILRENSIVAGPAVDGGTYLLGITQKAFNKQSFCTLAWQTDGLLDDLNRYACQNEHAFVTLCSAADIDNEMALRHVLRTIYGSTLYYHLAIVLLSILCSLADRDQNRETVCKLHHSYLHLFHRGPPVS